MNHILPVFLCLFLLLVLAACTNVSPIEPGVSSSPGPGCSCRRKTTTRSLANWRCADPLLREY